MGMIDGKQAKDILGCDDATLQQHINSGGIRAQRQGGKLLVEEEDVQRLANREDEEGTIVLTGESDNLQIDLGKVVDDSSETIVQSKGSSAAKDSQQITFGEDLEVVSLEDSRTADLGKTKPTTAAQGLSFTDSNTAVMTSVEETAVGGTTGPIETGPQRTGPGVMPNAESGRRSVRSSRRMNEIETQVPWYWVACLALTVAIGLFFVVPYYVVGNVTRPGNERDAGGNVLRGADDTIWSGMAGGIAGFDVEPNQDRWKKAGNTGEYHDIKSKDPQAQWRIVAYQGGLSGANERLNSFIIDKVSEEGGTIKATAKAGNKEYTVVEKKIPSADGGSEIKVLEAQVWPDSK